MATSRWWQGWQARTSCGCKTAISSTATLFDASNGSNVTATAVVDTIPPVISQVAATTDSP